MPDLHALERLSRAYFNDPARRKRLAKGEVLIEQDSLNTRLFFVISGMMAGTVPVEDEMGDEIRVELFRSGPSSFIGVHSFFSATHIAPMRVTAVADTELAWLDHNTPPVDEAQYGSLRRQLLPVIMEELAQRQLNLSRTAREREAAMHRLHLSENLSTLGRLSAGIAHELNNAVGVVSRTADHLSGAFSLLLQTHQPEMAAWFELGLREGQRFDSETVRRRGREMAERFGIPYEAAKTLAKICGNETPDALPDDPDLALSLWETGRACHDMRLAARHASDIVRSVKELGGADRERMPGIDVNATLREALSLLHSNLRKVPVEHSFASDLPFIWGNASELTQMWINIIKNACDALVMAKTPTPRISVATAPHKNGVEVILANNGPEIPGQLRRKLFQPHITTKRGHGGAMGLGLGLYIVKRLVDSYCGDMEVQSGPEETRFIIRLPLRHECIPLEE